MLGLLGLSYFVSCIEIINVYFLKNVYAYVLVPHEFTLSNIKTALMIIISYKNKADDCFLVLILMSMHFCKIIINPKFWFLGKAHGYCYLWITIMYLQFYRNKYFLAFLLNIPFIVLPSETCTINPMLCINNAY
jgi:hypothetical protein